MLGTRHPPGDARRSVHRLSPRDGFALEFTARTRGQRNGDFFSGRVIRNSVAINRYTWGITCGSGFILRLMIVKPINA